MSVLYSYGMLIENRLRVSNVLLVNCQALAAEAAKNIVLAGIGSLTIADDELVSEDDLGAQFLLSETDIGQNVRTRFPKLVVHCILQVNMSPARRSYCSSS